MGSEMCIRDRPGQTQGKNLSYKSSPRIQKPLDDLDAVGVVVRPDASCSAAPLSTYDRWEIKLFSVSGQRQQRLEPAPLALPSSSQSGRVHALMLP